MAGTGTAVGGTGTSELGCQLRWRFFGGPEFMAEDTDTWKTDTQNNINAENVAKKQQLYFVSRAKVLPGLSPKSAVRYPWPWGPKETWEGLSKGGRPSTPRPFVGPFTLRAVGTGEPNHT